jgi:hypothetical protein
LHISDGIKQGHVYDVVQRIGAVVVITEDEREVNVILEDKRLRLTWVPLRPRDSKTFLAVRVEVVRESDDIVLQIPAFRKSWDDVRPMVLERKYQCTTWGRRKGSYSPKERKILGTLINCGARR